MTRGADVHKFGRFFSAADDRYVLRRRAEGATGAEIAAEMPGERDAKAIYALIAKLRKKGITTPAEYEDATRRGAARLRVGRKPKPRAPAPEPAGPAATPPAQRPGSMVGMRHISPSWKDAGAMRAEQERAQAHAARLAEAPPLTEDEARRRVAEWLEKNRPTVLPPGHAETFSSDWDRGADAAGPPAVAPVRR